MSCCVCRHFLAGGTSSSGTSHDSWSPCGFHRGGGWQPGGCTRVWIQSLTQWWHRALDFFSTFFFLDASMNTDVTFGIHLQRLPGNIWTLLFQRFWEKDLCKNSESMMIATFVKIFFVCVHKLYCLSSVTGLLKRNYIKFKAMLQCGKLEFRKTIQFALIIGGADPLEHSGHKELQQHSILSVV